MSNSEKILVLQNKYHGAQDVYTSEEADLAIKPAMLEPNYYEFVETRTVEINPKKHITISTTDDYVNGYGYHNLRIIGSLDYVEEISFLIGGNIIEKTYPSLLKNYLPFSFLQESAMPASEFCQYQILLCSNIPVQIAYDIVKMREQQPIIKTIINQTQYNGLDIINLKSNQHQINLHFINPILLLKAYLPASAENVCLTLDNNVDYQLRFSKKETKEILDGQSCWQLFLGRRGINFSKVKNAILTFETNGSTDGADEYIVHIFGRNLNILKSLVGMTTLIYSN